jgi:transmembrane sensor
VDAGRRLAIHDDGTAAELRATSPESVGGWQGGQLIYDGVPLGDVAAEISRTTGVKLRTAPGASAIIFRGALQTGNDPARLVNDLAALSGTRATQDAEGWTLSR